MRCNVALISVDFPLPDTPVTQIKQPKGNFTVTFFRLLPEAPVNVRKCPFPFLRCFGNSIFNPLSGLRYDAVSVLLRSISAGVPHKHYTPAIATRLRTHIYDIIRCQHHILVVLYNNDGIAYVTQLLQRIDKTGIVALVQPYTRLVEYIQHIDQLRTDLCRQPYSLALATRKSCRGSVQVQLIEPYGRQKMQPAAYLLQYFCRYLALQIGQLIFYGIYPHCQVGNVLPVDAIV